MKLSVRATSAEAASEAKQEAISPEPIVILENYFRVPYDNAIATARTCYSSRVIRPEEVHKDEKAVAQRDRIAASVYKAGHHTTIQHATFQFILDKVSRQCIWSFLHSHPFYNSEQVSQRYVEVKPDRFAVPPLTDAQRELYLRTIQLMMEAYHKLIDLLDPTVKQEYKRYFQARDPDDSKWAGPLKKKRQEIARYVLPVATHAHLYHTISAITLLRYHRLCEAFDTPLEQRIVVTKMMDEVVKIDPDFAKLVEDPIPLEETPEYRLFTQLNGSRTHVSDAFIKEFDADLGDWTSKLVDYKAHGEATMAQAVRSVLGLTKVELSDLEAIDLVMNPAKNRYFSESLNVTTLAKLTRTMVHPHFTFKKKLSHTADSQDQRHRMTPASRPILAAHLISTTPDYITPVLIQLNAEAKAYYDGVMRQVWQAIDQLLNDGVKAEYAMYLLPNAFPIRFEESGDLLNFHHKWVHRLCYTAQEEIWKSCRDEVMQVREVSPQIGQYLLAPCWPRKQAKIAPYCPEGDRFCGLPVWNYPLEAYSRTL